MYIYIYTFTKSHTIGYEGGTASFSLGLSCQKLLRPTGQLVNMCISHVDRLVAAPSQPGQRRPTHRLVYSLVTPEIRLNSLQRSV